jgi:hypothetical protein
MAENIKGQTSVSTGSGTQQEDSAENSTDALQQVIMFVAPEPNISDSSAYVDDPVRRFVQQAAKDALELPETTAPSPCEKIPIVITIGNIQDTIQLRLAMLPMVLVERYCAGGRTAVDSFAREASAQVINLGDPEFRWPLDAYGNKIPPPPKLCADAFIREFVRGEELLESMVFSAIVLIAQDAWAIGRSRIEKLKAQLLTDLSRYLGEASSGAEGGPGGAGGGRGGNLGGASSGAEGGPGGKEGRPVEGKEGRDTKGLLEAMNELIDAANALLSARLPISGEGDAPGGAEGGPGGPATTSERETKRQEKIKPAEKKYIDTLTRVIAPPLNHVIAPALLAVLFGANTTPIPKPSSEQILAAADTYLNNTLQLLTQALPKQDVVSDFGAHLKKSVTPRLQKLTFPTPMRVDDRVELRAALWAMDIHDYIYEPLNDEWLLLGLLDTYRNSLEAAETSEDALGSGFRYRVLASLLEAQQSARSILQLESELNHQGTERIFATAAFLDFLAVALPIVFPPLAPIAGALLAPLAGGLTYTALAANAIQLIADTPIVSKRGEGLMVGSLLSENYSSYLELVASQPTMISVCASLVIEQAAMIKAFGILGKANPKLALSIRIALDVKPSAEPLIKELLGQLLQEQSRTDRSQ